MLESMIVMIAGSCIYHLAIKGKEAPCNQPNLTISSSNNSKLTNTAWVYLVAVTR